MSNLIAAFALIAPLAALLLRLADVTGAQGMLDIQAFVGAGELVVRHGVGAAYDEAAVRAVQAKLSGTTDYMPWSYPPTTTLLMAPLAWLNWPVAQLIVGLCSIAGVAWFAHAHAPDAPTRNAALAMMAGPLTVNVASGQFGALFALALGLALAAPRAATFALVALKPHLLAGSIIASLGDRRLFITLAGGGVLTLAAIGLIEAASPGAVAGWLAALNYSKGYLADGQYGLGRMVSAYAFLRTWMGHEAAFALHLAHAAAVIGTCAFIMRGEPARTRLIALSLAGLTLSPYMYDYDMVALGVGFLLIARPLPASPALLLCVIAAGISGLFSMPLYEATGKFPPTFLALSASAILLARLAVARPLPADPAAAGESLAPTPC